MVVRMHEINNLCPVPEHMRLASHRTRQPGFKAERLHQCIGLNSTSLFSTVRKDFSWKVIYEECTSSHLDVLMGSKDANRFKTHGNPGLSRGKQGQA